MLVAAGKNQLPSVLEHYPNQVEEFFEKDFDIGSQYHMILDGGCLTLLVHTDLL